MWGLYRITIIINDGFIDWAKANNESVYKLLKSHFIEKTKEQREKEAHARALQSFEEDVIERKQDITIAEMRCALDKLEDNN